MRPAAWVLLCCLLGACGPAAAPAPLPIALDPGDDQLSGIVAAALEADARLETADSLYTADATIIADGLARFTPPRFAGIGPGGEVAVTSSRLEVRGGFAWAHVEYRWISTTAGRASAGRVTLVLVPSAGGAWRIHHAHSSSPDG
jgi:hypothetical protein